MPKKRRLRAAIVPGVGGEGLTLTRLASRSGRVEQQRVPPVAIRVEYNREMPPVGLTTRATTRLVRHA